MGDNDALKDIFSSKHDYRYSDYINAPQALNMRGEGSLGAIEDNIGGLIAYVEVLSTGYGEGSKVGGPLGNKYFISTGTKCKNVEDGKIVDRSIYINNIPTGDIKLFGSDIGLNLDGAEFKGLMPGVLESMGDINPFNLLSAFTESQTPDCQSLALPVGKAGEPGIDPPNCSYTSSCETKYMSISDINKLDIHNFPDNKRPKIKKSKNLAGKEGFQPYNKNNNAKFDNNNDHMFIKIYYSALGLLLLYMLLKILHHNKN